MGTINKDNQELGQFIPVHYHAFMISDQMRVQGFKSAIDIVVKEGARVVELGGGTGILSYFASRRANKVWYVEKNPALVAVAKKLSRLNPGTGNISYLEADAAEFIPFEKVDVVICEMLHTALLREKQISVISAFKRHYLDNFGPPFPAFIPDVTFNAVQPVEENFNFHGFYAPIVLFQDPYQTHEETLELGVPFVYQMLEYQGPLPETCNWEGVLTIEKPGTLNALRFITKSILAIAPDNNSTIDWHNQYMIVPLPEPIEVQAGTQIKLSFCYEAGASIESLSQSIKVTTHDVLNQQEQAGHVEGLAPSSPN